MNTLPQKEAAPPVAMATKSARIAEDCWEAARLRAFEGRTSITEVINSALRQQLGLRVPMGREDGAEKSASSAA